MFEDSLLESGGKFKTKRGATTTIAVVAQIAFVGVLVLIPLIYTEALPKGQLTTFLVAPPPPPPPPPPPAAAPVVKVHKVETDLNNGQLRTPTAIPKKVAMIKEDEPPPSANAGVMGGVAGRRTGRPDGWRHRRHYQFHPRRRSQGSDAAESSRVAGRVGRLAAAQGDAQLIRRWRNRRAFRARSCCRLPLARTAASKTCGSRAATRC